MSGPCGWPQDRDAPHPDPAASLLIEDDLELRVPNERDADELFLNVDANRDYLREWLPWVDDVTSVEDEAAAIRRSAETREKGKGCFYLICLEGNIVGTLSLNSIDWDNRGFVVGYWISEESMGKGIVTKSCARLLDHCFDDLCLHRGALEVAVENNASIAIAERLGMRLEGITREREWLYDHYVDASLYAITAPEWRERSQG